MRERERGEVEPVLLIKTCLINLEGFHRNGKGQRVKSDRMRTKRSEKGTKDTNGLLVEVEEA